jgi:hypothetical protein
VVTSRWQARLVIIKLGISDIANRCAILGLPLLVGRMTFSARASEDGRDGCGESRVWSGW